MARYAEGTTVPVDRSKAEIEKTLSRYEASGFGYLVHRGKVTIGFEMRGRRYRMDIMVSPIAKEERRQWRVLLLRIKSLLEMAEEEDFPIETAFLPFTVMPDGRTMDEWAQPQLQESLTAGYMPPMLPSHS